MSEMDLRIEFPVRYDAGTQWIWTKDGQHLLDMRGWGYLTGTGGLHLPDDEAMAIQDARGEFVARAINEQIKTDFRRAKPEQDEVHAKPYLTPSKLV